MLIVNICFLKKVCQKEENMTGVWLQVFNFHNKLEHWNSIFFPVLFACLYEPATEKWICSPLVWACKAEVQSSTCSELKHTKVMVKLWCGFLACKPTLFATDTNDPPHLVPAYVSRIDSKLRGNFYWQHLTYVHHSIPKGICSVIW